MEQVFDAIEAWPVAAQLRQSRWSYAALNGLHVAAVGVLVGATLVMNLRLLGFWRNVERAPLLSMLVPVAATALAAALLTGPVLFSLRAAEYASLGVFRIKLLLIATGTLAALVAHYRHGLVLEEARLWQRRLHAGVSLAAWFGALACGRLIAFF